MNINAIVILATVLICVAQTVQNRGAAVIKARKLSSAVSAAKAISDHVRSWFLGTPEVRTYMILLHFHLGSHYIM